MVRRAQSNVNVIVFVTLVMAALIIVVWYIGTVRPTRLIIGAALEDLDEFRVHLRNACSVDTYEATYRFSSPGPGNMSTNTTHYCIETEILRICRDAPCDLAERNVAFREGLMAIAREDEGLVTISTVTSEGSP